MFELCVRRRRLPPPFKEKTTRRQTGRKKQKKMDLGKSRMQTLIAFALMKLISFPPARI